MRITERPDEAALLLDEAHARQNGNREPGLHASDLIYCARKAWWRARGITREHNQKTQVLFLLGAGHHATLQWDNYDRIAEARLDLGPVLGVSDPIICSVDTLRLDAEDGIDWPQEVKTTRASVNKPPPYHYFDQLATYCLAAGTTYGDLIVVHLTSAQVKFYRIEFEPHELAAWKEELIRRYLEIKAPALPPGTEHYPWECGGCPMNVNAGGPCNPDSGRRVSHLAIASASAWMTYPEPDR